MSENSGGTRKSSVFGVRTGCRGGRSFKSSDRPSRRIRCAWPVPMLPSLHPLRSTTQRTFNTAARPCAQKTTQRSRARHNTAQHPSHSAQPTTQPNPTQLICFSFQKNARRLSVRTCVGQAYFVKGNFDRTYTTHQAVRCCPSPSPADTAPSAHARVQTHRHRHARRHRCTPAHLRTRNKHMLPCRR